MAMNGGSVESDQLAIERWTREDRGRPFVVSSSFRPPGGARQPPNPAHYETEFGIFILLFDHGWQRLFSDVFAL